MGCHPAASCRTAGLSRRCNGIHRYSVHGGGANVWLRIGCWGDDSAGSLRCKPFVCAHRSTPSQYGSGRVAALTSYSQVGCGNGRCIGHRPQLCEGLIIHRSRNRQDFKTCMGGVDARVSAGAFAGIRTRTGQFLGLSPLPVGLRKRYASNPQGYARAVHDRSGRFVPDHCTHACGGRAYCGMGHDVDHGLCRPCSAETVSTSCGSADKRHGRPRLRKPCPHSADRLYRIHANPSDGGLFASATHRLMGANDGLRVRRTNGDADHRTRPAWS